MGWTDPRCESDRGSAREEALKNANGKWVWDVGCQGDMRGMGWGGVREWLIQVEMEGAERGRTQRRSGTGHSTGSKGWTAEQRETEVCQTDKDRHYSESDRNGQNMVRLETGLLLKSCNFLTLPDGFHCYPHYYSIHR